MSASPPTPLADAAAEQAQGAVLSAAVLGDLARTFGRSGVEHSGGKVVQPWNRFTWREWAAEADKMTLDAQVMLAWGVVQSAILSPGVEIRPGDPDDPLSARMADAVREALGLEGRPGLTWRSFDEWMADLSWFAYYGAMPMEVRWEYDPRTGWDVPVDLEPRIPSSIERWGEADALGPITQIVRGSGRRPEPIPGRKFILFTLGKMGTDWTGRGKARSAWAPWRRRLELQDARQIGCNRLGVLPPVIETSLEAVASLVERQILPEGTYTTLVQDLQNNLRRVQSGDGSVLTSVAGVTAINWGTADNFDPAKILAAEESEATEIHAAFGTLFLRMGITGEGSHALAQTHLEVLRSAAVAYTDIIASAINGPWRAGGGLIGAFCELNFGKFDPRLLPRLVFTGLEPNILAEALGTLPALSAAGWATPDLGAKRAIRQALDLPPLDDEAENAAEAARAEASAAAVPAFARLSATRPSAASAFARAFARRMASVERDDG